MSHQYISSKGGLLDLRHDCLEACSQYPNVYKKLGLAHIAITGGTGFLGTWIAEMVAALNDEFGLKITLDLYARNTLEWVKSHPLLASRDDIHLFSQDVRSPFQFRASTNFIIHAAGIPNNRVHASDPLRVIQTTVEGIQNTLDAASQLDNLTRFLNVSSGLVSGASKQHGALSENDYFAIPSGQLHLVYVDAKRSAESIAAVYRSQFRLPISTIRPYTFAGPYQPLDRPWAINSFLGDALMGRDIRIHGDGSNRRSYLYGSDAAWWTLLALVDGVDGGIYNLGSPDPISHIELAQLICEKVTPKLGIIINTAPYRKDYADEFYPRLANTQNCLKVRQTCSLNQIIDKTWQWFSRNSSVR